jgi:p-aminobenzoyl-glutamate transporter AbgT
MFTALYLLIGYLYSVSPYVKRQLQDSKSDNYLRMPKNIQKVGDDFAQRIVMIFFLVFMISSLFFGSLSFILNKSSK